MCLCVLVLRKATPSHAWYVPTYNAPFRPYCQIFGIISGMVLLWFMGSEAYIGAMIAIIGGVIIYTSYGKKHNHPEITPWETFRLMFTNPDEVEKRRIYAAFHAADSERNNHLNLHEFIAAMEALEIDSEGHNALREYFHVADSNNDGVIDIDEFLKHIEELIE